MRFPDTERCICCIWNMKCLLVCCCCYLLSHQISSVPNTQSYWICLITLCSHIEPAASTFCDGTDPTVWSVHCHWICFTTVCSHWAVTSHWMCSVLTHVITLNILYRQGAVTTNVLHPIFVQCAVAPNAAYLKMYEMYNHIEFTTFLMYVHEAWSLIVSWHITGGVPKLSLTH